MSRPRLGVAPRLLLPLLGRRLPIVCLPTARLPPVLGPSPRRKRLTIGALTGRVLPLRARIGRAGVSPPARFVPPPAPIVRLGVLRLPIVLRPLIGLRFEPRKRSTIVRERVALLEPRPERIGVLVEPERIGLVDVRPLRIGVELRRVLLSAPRIVVLLRDLVPPMTQRCRPGLRSRELPPRTGWVGWDDLRVDRERVHGFVGVERLTGEFLRVG